MKILILLAFFTIILSGIIYPQNTIKDGLYLIDRIDTIATQTEILSEKEIAIYFSPMFEEFNQDEFTRIIIDTTQFVPLELEEPPKTEQQTDLKKKLLLSLTKDASEKLETFTTENLMRKVALVVGGEALTVHKIKAAITGGQLQITRCTDNACETLCVKLKGNVVK